MISFNVPATFKVTLPPPTYPSTAPYARLNGHFVRHFKSGLLTRFILQTILYKHVSSNVDLHKVRMRRNYKTTLRLMRKKGEEDMNSDDAMSSRNSDGSMTSDNETEDGSTDSNPFGVIHYFTDKHSDRSVTNYETFIDHYEDEGDGKDSLHLEVTSKGSCCFANLKNLECVDNQLRDSLPFGSNTVRLADNCDTKPGGTPVHTSTASINLSNSKSGPTSELSNLSSVADYNLFGGHLALDNLLNLDDMMPVKNTLRIDQRVAEKHNSMPTLFVGNRFNAGCQPTNIHVPSRKDPPDNSAADNDDEADTLARSRSPPAELTIPSPIPGVPNSEARDEPALVKFRNLSKNEPFGRHNLNSDKRLSQSNMRLSATKKDLEANSPLSSIILIDGYPSTRSSDSGMVGSYTLPSPDSWQIKNVAQGGEQPPKVPLVKSDITDSGQYGDEAGSVLRQFNAGQSKLDAIVADDERPIRSRPIVCKAVAVAGDKPNRSKSADQISQRMISVPVYIDLDAIPQEIDRRRHKPEKVYRTGLYAHWWKKEALPSDVALGLALETPSSSSPSAIPGNRIRTDKKQHDEIKRSIRNNNAGNASCSCAATGGRSKNVVLGKGSGKRKTLFELRLSILWPI